MRRWPRMVKYAGLVMLPLIGCAVLVTGAVWLTNRSDDGALKWQDSLGEAPWGIAEPWSGPAPEPPNLFPVRDNGKWGYMDETGRLVIDYQFDGAQPFSEGMAVVRMGVKRGYIDESGELVIPIQYSHAAPFSCGLALVGNVSNYGATNEEWYIDKVGNPVIYPEADWWGTGQFSEGLAAVRFVNEDYSESRGYMDTSGKLVIWLPGAESADEFSEGLAAVWGGYIDRSGRFVVKEAFLYSSEFSGGLAVVDTRSGWAIIDTDGATVADIDFLPATVFPDARGLHEGRAAVAGENGWGYVDRAGELVIPAQFYSACDFAGGLACVYDEKDKMAYIDLDGAYVWREN